MHARRHHKDVKCPMTQERRRHGFWRERPVYLPALSPTGNVTLSHCLITLDICILLHNHSVQSDFIDSVRDNICKRTLETRNTMTHFRIWSLLFRSFVCVLSGVGLALGAGVWWIGHLGKDHTEPWCLQGHRMILFSVFNCKRVLWPYLPQILLSHFRVTCLPRRCQRSVTCYTALVSVNCTSQVRQGWQGYYNIWCDVAFCYHHLTFSSFSKLRE